mmetsp:Transcript_68964/g.164490  ORF Transcript_68964/g.164490 Transcript_68964/m.164490 type:complete len:219 (-) Transcript_68964:34-690(-)
MPSRDALGGPHGRGASRVREHVEHPPFLRVCDEQRLSRAFERPRAVEAVLLSEGAHPLHSLLGRRRPLHRDLRKSVDRQKRLAALPHGECAEDARACRLRDTHLILVDDAVRRFEVGERTRHLGDGADGVEGSLVAFREVLLHAPRVAHVPRKHLGGEEDVTHAPRGVVRRFHAHQPRVHRPVTVVAVRDHPAAVDRALWRREHRRAAMRHMHAREQS